MTLLPVVLSACAGGLRTTIPARQHAQLMDGVDLALHTVYKIEVFRLDLQRYHIAFLVGISPQLITQDYSDELQTGEVFSGYIELLDAFLYGWFGQKMTPLEQEIANRARIERAVNRVRAKRWMIAPPAPPWPAPTICDRSELELMEGEESEY